MAEGLAIVGGIASISQILELTIKSAKRLRKLSQDVKDAPLEIKRLQNKLSALQIVLQGVTKLIENVDEDTIFPPEQRSMLEDVVKQVQEDVEELEALRVKVVARAPDSLRGRLSWGVKDKAAAERLCARLRETEQCLSTVLQALDFQLSVLSYIAVCAKTASTAQDTVQQPQRNGPGPLVAGRKTYYSLAIAANTWLRSLGFFGALTKIDGENGWQSRLRVGFQFPPWLLSKSVSLDFQLESIADQQGLQILPGSIQLQNRVPIDSPFLQACLKGNVELIEQHLRNGTGRVSDRSMCEGRTPLLLAIDSDNLDAIECLLASGADPNIGDDEGLLPLFHNAGYKGIDNFYPDWTEWLEAMKLLIRYGASVHETLDGVGLAFCETWNMDIPCGILPYFRLLEEEQYMEFQSDSPDYYSSLYWNIRLMTADDKAILHLLSRNGADLSRIEWYGETLLHACAEQGADVLEYICATGGCLTHIDQQDAAGQTPLHYAIHRSWFGLNAHSIRFLLEKGADPHIKAHRHQIYEFSEPFSPLELAERNDEERGTHIADEYVAILKEFGHSIPAEYEELRFEDALEAQEQLVEPS